MGDLLKIKPNNTYGLLTVIKRVDDHITPKGQHSAKFLCECKCGNQIEVIGNNLYRENTTSCGCLRKQSVHDKLKKYNRYDLSGDFGIGYTSNTNEEFWFDKEDYELIKDYCWSKHHDGYIYSTNNNVYITLHSVVMKCENPSSQIDHICTENKFDNRKCNLREVRFAENMWNRKTPTNNTSGVKGVHFCKSKNRWAAGITVNKHRICKYFSNKEDAISYRKTLEDEYHSEYSYDNSQKKYTGG